ncbi:DUF1800 family protein [Piscinibacter sp. XHJ-5]|uniref:DUF1800 domain-containing protein n=1 Tax=Piscinibacter sp. XHJ-5 TaxID=3037797 RepID=UPI0024529767|nr:DUF1800 family protein [Piscinibacter sp. XHJ-5]
MGARVACWTRGVRWACASAAVAALVACGGGKDDASGDAVGGAEIEKPATRAEAARFLTQATFGPTDAEVDRVMSLGYGPWIDDQFSKPRASHRLAWDAADAALRAANPSGNGAGQDEVINSFWKQAIAGDDALRQRVAYSLSQIFVVSMQDGSVGNNTRGVADYLDMLGDKGLGNYRELLESVSRHPIMGMYLSSMRNQKADARTGRVPDENYAREVMQLFSIGLVELNLDGSAKESAGQPLETYDAADIAGLAKVFTGWSWNCPDWPDSGCFFGGSSGGVSDPDRAIKPMLGYPQYHSPEEKTFLGATIAAHSPGDPTGDLASALDTLAGHSNVGPFIGKQLIQRLVTSNPSPAYVAAVAAAFEDNGSGVRGDMKAVIKAVLMHPEARTTSSTSGKLREPVLKLSAFLRAFGFRSDTGSYRVGNTDNPGTQLGQTPLRSPSVFNFYRPGFVPPGTAAAAAQLTVPEMQIAHETTVAGYVNYMRDNIAQGVGQFNGTVNGVALNRRDLQADLSAELVLADQPPALLDRLNDKLMYGSMPAALKSEIQGAIEKIVIPALNGTGSNQAQVDAARRTRVNAALLLTLASPEFQTQK